MPLQNILNVGGIERDISSPLPETTGCIDTLNPLSHEEVPEFAASRAVVLVNQNEDFRAHIDLRFNSLH